ncbi:hypothetical protein PHBOTO_006284 [Pseudozyma hubeiensis]|nr:hypothetical protein PHBOTO_006284 [Pseudozyma hubeiensis]
MFFPKTLLLASVSLSLFLCTTTFASPVKLDASERFDSASGKPDAALDRNDDVTPGVHNLDPFIVNSPRLTRRQDVYDEVRGHRSAGSSPKDRKLGQPHINNQSDGPPGGDGPPQGHGPPEGDNPPEGHGPPGPWMKRSLAEQEQSVAAASDAHQLSHPAVADLQERDAGSDEDDFFGDEFDDAGRDPGLEKRDVEDSDVNMPTFGEPAPQPKVPKHAHLPPRSVELQKKRNVGDGNPNVPVPGNPGFGGHPARKPMSPKVPEHPHRPPHAVELHEKRYFEDVGPIPGSGGAPWFNGNPASNPVFPKPPKHPHRLPGEIVLYERDEVFDPPYARYTPQERAAQPASHLDHRDSKQENIESEAFHWSWAPWGDKGTPLYHGAEPRPHIGPHEKGLERRDSILSGVDEDEESGSVVHAPSYKVREGLRDGPTLTRRYHPSGGYKPPTGGPDEQAPTSGTQGSDDSDGPPLARRAYFPGPGNEPWASTGDSGGSGNSRSGDGGPSRRSLVDENGVRFVGAKRSEQQSVNDAHLDSVPADHHASPLARRYHPSGGYTPPSGGSGGQSGSSRSDGNARGGPPHLGNINENGVRFLGVKRSEQESVEDVHLDADPTYQHLPALARRDHVPGPNDPDPSSWSDGSGDGDAPPPARRGHAPGPNDPDPSSWSDGSGDGDRPPPARQAFYPGRGNLPGGSTVQPGTPGSSGSGNGGLTRRSYINEKGVHLVGTKRSDQDAVSHNHLPYPPMPHPAPGDDGSGPDSGLPRHGGANFRQDHDNEHGARYVGGNKRSEQESVEDVHLDSVPHSPYIPHPPPDDDGPGWDNGGPKPWWDHYNHGGRTTPPGQANEHGAHYIGDKRSVQESVSDTHLDSALKSPYIPHPPPGDDGSGWDNGGPKPWWKSYGHGGKTPPPGQFNEHGARYVGGVKRSVQDSVDDVHLKSVPHSPYTPRPPPGDDGSGWYDDGPQPFWHGGNDFPAGQVNEHGVRYAGAKRSEPKSVRGIILDSVSTAKYSHLPDPDPINGGTGWNGGPMPWGRGGRRPPAGQVNENSVQFTGSKRSVEAEGSASERHLGKRSSLPGDDGGVLEGNSDQSQESSARKVSDPYNRGCTKDDRCNGRPGRDHLAKRDGVDHEEDQTPAALHYPTQRVTDLTSQTRDLYANLKQNPQQSQSALVDSSNPSYTSLISPSIYITSSLEHQPSSALGFYGICRCDRFPDDGKLDGQSSSAIGSCVSKFVEIASKTAKCKFSTIAEVDCVEVGGKDQMTDGDNVWWQQAFCKRCVDAGGVSDASFKCPAGYTSDGRVDTSDGDGSSGMGQRDEGGVESEKRSSEKRSGLVPGGDQVAGQSRTDPQQGQGAQQ